MEQLIGRAPEHICEFFRSANSGSVEMVNSRGIYLQFGCRHILLCHNRYGIVPNGVAIDGWECLPTLLSPGQPVQAENHILSFSTGSLAVQSVPHDTRILLPEKATLKAGIGFLLSQAKSTGLSSLAYPLFTGEIPKMNLYCETALVHVRTLLRALKKENTDDIYRSVSFLLGLGPGLTPSGDDLLSGILYGLRHSPLRDSVASTALCSTIRELAAQRTNAVSADYLMAIADDAPFDRMAAAWADPAAGAAELLQIGSNSGGEMLLGLLCAASLQIPL